MLQVETYKKVRYVIIFWDWKDHPDEDELTAAVKQGLTFFRYVPDVGSDDCMLVVSDKKISEKTAQRIYELDA